MAEVIGVQSARMVVARRKGVESKSDGGLNRAQLSFLQPPAQFLRSRRDT